MVTQGVARVPLPSRLKTSFVGPLPHESLEGRSVGGVGLCPRRGVSDGRHDDGSGGHVSCKSRGVGPVGVLESSRHVWGPCRGLVRASGESPIRLKGVVPLRVTGPTVSRPPCVTPVVPGSTTAPSGRRSPTTDVLSAGPERARLAPDKCPWRGGST